MTTSDQLQTRIRSLGSCVVAFSGGVDSSLVAALAVRALGERALAVTAVSPALATGELDGARAVACVVGIRHETITTAELERDGYRANGHDRCYHCKTELYDHLSSLAARRRYAAVLSGANADDVGDWRPGLTAAAEHAVIHPLLEAGVGKEEVRQLARGLGVPSAEKPASPCLASRIPYGTQVDPVVLAQIDRAELAVKALGYGVLRVRHFGSRGRVELAEAELEALTDERRQAIVEAVTSAGYSDVEIADEAFRSGSLNASFTKRLVVAT
jgi:pyridinium-3,5-biscarboxylic acid mononucleotide sulfurtransferase